jgi:hypothetical protein
VITKDFHFAKDFPRIRGKSFVIMVGVLAPAGLSRHIRRVVGPDFAGVQSGAEAGAITPQICTPLPVEFGVEGAVRVEGVARRLRGVA